MRREGKTSIDTESEFAVIASTGLSPEKVPVGAYRPVRGVHRHRRGISLVTNAAAEE
jgi:hypothetical protein